MMKKPTHILTVSALSCCLLLLGCSKAKEKPSGEGSTTASDKGAVELKAKWEVGKKYVQRMEMASTTEMKLPQAKEPMEQKTTMQMDYAISAIKERPEGGRELELEFLGNKMEVRAGDRVVLEFDSAQDSAGNTNNPALPVLRNMVGSKIRFLVDTNSKVEKVEGYQEFLARISGDGKSVGGEMAKAMFNEDMLRQFSNSADALPKHPVKAGDKWPHKTELNMGPIGKMVVDMNYTFKGMEQHGERQCARLDFTGKMSSSSGASGGAASVKMERGEMTGTTWFDPQAGVAVDTQSAQEIKMKIDAKGQEITSKTSQKVNLKLTEVTDL